MVVPLTTCSQIRASSFIDWAVEVLWSPLTLSFIALVIGGVSLYLLYMITEEMAQRIDAKMQYIIKENIILRDKLAQCNALFTELEMVELNNTPTSNLASDIKMQIVQNLLHKIRNMRQNDKLTIDVNLTNTSNE